MAEFKFLHLSDLHFAKHSNRPPFSISQRKYLKRRIDWALQEGFFAGAHSRSKSRELALFVRKEMKDVNAIIVTGDIATTGEKFDLRAALEFFEGDDENPFDSSIRELKNKVILLPGNHDRYKQCPVDPKKLDSKRGLAIFDTFFRIIEKVRNIKNVKNIFFLPGNATFDNEFSEFYQGKVSEKIVENAGVSVGIFSADFTLKTIMDCTRPRYLNMLAQGKVHEDVLGELVTTTKRFTEQATPAKKIVVWATHFPPTFPEIEYDSKKSFIQNCRKESDWAFKKSTSRLLQADKLINAAKDCGVSCILTGHLHIPLNEKIDSDLEVFGTGTATQYTYNEYLRDYHDIETNSYEVNCFHLLSMNSNNYGFSFTRTCYNFDHSVENRARSIRIEIGKQESRFFNFNPNCNL